MTALPFEQARRCVIDVVSRHVQSVPSRPVETVLLDNCVGRVLAENVYSDRPYPPLPRSIRDGFAVRAADFPGSVRVVGEVRAGSRYEKDVHAGEAIEIMTGAPVPPGADAVIMVEHATRDGNSITADRAVNVGDFIVPKGAECCPGAAVVEAGTRIDFGHVPVLASVGAMALNTFSVPEVSILATGDEIIDAGVRPADHQIRNSNSYSVAAQVRRAGAIARVLPVAKDSYESTRSLIEEGLRGDLLLLSGGVSAGKYDIVENVLADLGAEFFFDRVLIQPGQPVVFGRVRDRFFFGLPGNPASTMVTFEIFARAALDLLSGCRRTALPLLSATLRTEFRHQPGLTRFLPALLSADGRELTPLKWQGSGDVFALARANAFLVARDDRETYLPGDQIEVLPR